MLVTSIAGFANLASNGGFETQDGTDTRNAASWNQGGDQGREDWAAEWGSYGLAFYGWVNGGNGYFEQYINCDTNATYYFRIRGSRQSNFDSGSIYMKLRFYPSDSDWTLIKAYTNSGVSLSSPTDWTTYEIEGVTPPGAGIVQMRCEFAGAVDTGGSQAFMWDNVQLWDRRSSYRIDEIVDEFSYDPDFDDGIAGKNRGGGFAGGWNLAWGSADISDWDFNAVAGYPEPYGNKLHIPSTGGGAYRNFDAMTTGSVFMAAFFNYNNETTANWAGVSFMSNGVERAFFGGVSHDANTKMTLALDSYGGPRVDSSYTFNAGIGQDYVLVAKYNFSRHELKAIAYWNADTIPYREPLDWTVTAQLNPAQMPYVNGIRLAAGGTNPGDVYFDEVRVATSWYGLLGTEPPLSGTIFKFR